VQLFTFTDGRPSEVKVYSESFLLGDDAKLYTDMEEWHYAYPRGRASEGGTKETTQSAMTKWENYPNLRRRPHAPNLGRGRLQRQIRRAFVGADTCTSAQIYDWCFARRRRRIPQRHRYSVWRVLVRIADPIGRAETVGRPRVWKLRE
jgi:hypothetical protein